MEIKFSREYFQEGAWTLKFRRPVQRLFRVKPGLSGCFKTGLDHRNFLLRGSEEMLMIKLVEAGALEHGPEISTLNIDRLKELDPRHAIFSLRYGAVGSKWDVIPGRKTESGHSARLEALIGRHCRGKDVLELIPEAAIYCYLAEYYLVNGDIKSAKACMDWAAQNDQSDYHSKPIFRIVQFFLHHDLDGKCLEGLRQAMQTHAVALAFGRLPGEGRILEDGMAFSQKMGLALRLALECARSRADFLDNLGSLARFVVGLRERVVVEWPYWEALLAFGVINSKENLQTLLEMEQEHIAKGDYEKRDMPIVVDNPTCPDGDPVDAYVDFTLPEPVPLTGKLSLAYFGKEVKMRQSYSETRPDKLGVLYGKKVGNWRYASAQEAALRDRYSDYVVNDVGREEATDYIFKIAKVFSGHAKGFAANFCSLIDFVEFLAGRGILVKHYLELLLKLGETRPEYRVELGKILKQEESNVLSTQHLVREVPVVIRLFCEDFHDAGTTRGFSLQPVPCIESLFPRKCLVLDCDGVLWKGTVEEDGIENIEVLVEFQERIRALKERGVVLALNTRNDRVAIEKVFRERKDMALKMEDFAAVEANWGLKTDNLRAIADRLNLGMESLVFIDDTTQEREMVKGDMPQVFVPETPADTAQYVPFLAQLEMIFGQETVTEEDRRRTKLYAVRQQAEAILGQAALRKDALLLLEMKARFQAADPNIIPRLAQITQRANQFNLTTRRYSEDDMRTFLASPDYRVFSLRLEDKFGDAGTVGLMILHKDESSVFSIDTFAISCRALGRTVEQTFMALVVNALKKEGAKYLKGDYKLSGRNPKVSEIYRELGFIKTGGDDFGNTSWELNMEKIQMEASPYITIIKE